MESLEGYDARYFETFCAWLWNKQKEVTQPRKFWIMDISLKVGPVKFVEHTKIYINVFGGLDVELGDDYAEIKVYPHRK